MPYNSSICPTTALRNRRTSHIKYKRNTDTKLEESHPTFGHSADGTLHLAGGAKASQMPPTPGQGRPATGHEQRILRQHRAEGPGGGQRCDKNGGWTEPGTAGEHPNRSSFGGKGWTHGDPFRAEFHPWMHWEWDGTGVGWPPCRKSANPQTSGGKLRTGTAGGTKCQNQFHQKECLSAGAEENQCVSANNETK